jgi:hypothetical protein
MGFNKKKMDLTLREGYFIKFAVKLKAVISHNTYYGFIPHFVNWFNNRLSVV